MPMRYGQRVLASRGGMARGQDPRTSLMPAGDTGEQHCAERLHAEVSVGPQACTGVAISYSGCRRVVLMLAIAAIGFIAVDAHVTFSLTYARWTGIPPEFRSSGRRCFRPLPSWDDSR